MIAQLLRDVAALMRRRSCPDEPTPAPRAKPFVAPAPSWDKQTRYSVSYWHGRFWLDRINPAGLTEQCVGPYPTQRAAQDAADQMNATNRDG